MPASRDSKLIRAALLVFFALLICYAIYEAWGLLNGPAIEVPSQTITMTEAYTLVSGHTERITELRLNGKTIPVTENGDFEEPFLLAPGTNHLILEARDAHGRTTEKTLTILYVPQAPSPTGPASSTL